MGLENKDSKVKYEYDGKEILVKTEEVDEDELKELEEIASKYLEENRKEEERKEMERRIKIVEEEARKIEELKAGYKAQQGEAEEEDLTNPDHYKQNGYESIDIMEVKYGTRAVMAFSMLNWEKYTFRAAKKGNYELDMQKAHWYLDKYRSLSKKLNTEEEIEGLSEILRL